MEGLNIFPSHLCLLAINRFHPESELLIPHQVINPRTSQDQMLLSFKRTCFPGGITGICPHLSEPPTLSILSSPAQPLPASGHAGWEGRMLLAIGGQGPQRELWQRFPRGMPSSLSREHTQVLPPMSLQKQWVSYTCSFAFPGQEIPLQSPALMLLLWLWKQPAWRNHRVSFQCPFPKAGARFALECHLICTAFWGSVAHLWNGWLIIRPSEGIRLKHH